MATTIEDDARLRALVAGQRRRVIRVAVVVAVLIPVVWIFGDVLQAVCATGSALTSLGFMVHLYRRIVAVAAAQGVHV